MLEGMKIVKRGTVLIDENMKDAIELRLFVMQPLRKQEESRDQIARIKEFIEKKGARSLPPLVVEDMGDYVFVHDGQHRALALYEEGITHHPAVFVKRR